MRRPAFVTLLLALAFAGGWFAREAWQTTSKNYERAERRVQGDGDVF